MHTQTEPAVRPALGAPLPCRLDLAERLYGARRFTDALVAGQALLTAPAANHDEQARVHGFVARCLTALQAHGLAARHRNLAHGRGTSAEGPATERVRRRLAGGPGRPSDWPAERRGRG